MASQPQQRWLHDLIERIDAVVWEADAKTFQFTYVSPSAERLLGFPAEAWLEPGFWVGRLHPEDRDRAVEACVTATRAGDNHQLEYRLVALDGSEVWVEDDVRLVQGPDESPVALRGVLVDATSRKRDEEILGFLFEHGSDLVTIVGADGRIRCTSPAIGRVLGYGPGELVGVEALELIHPEDRAGAQSALAGSAQQVEFRCWHREGGWRRLESIGRTMVGGSVGDVIIASRDVTSTRRTDAIAEDLTAISAVVEDQAALLRGAAAELVDTAHWGATLARQLQSADRAAATVLLVDDDGLVRRAVGKALAGIGYHVLFADSAQAALALDADVDLALVDAHLDQRLRSDLGQKLRARDPGIRIVVMSVLPEPQDYEFAEAVLAKPFDLDELRETLARVLNDR